VANLVYIATSIDGFIADSDGGLDWLFEIPNPTGDDFGYSKFMERVDAIVMGRATFEKVLTFGQWPYKLPVFVVSDSMTSLPPSFRGDDELIDFVGGAPSDIMTDLDACGLRDLYIDGGDTIHRFLAADLIDELIITRIPVILGTGIPLFRDHDRLLRFEHLETQVYNNALVKSRYRRRQTTGGEAET
jgi:dihydrofolate reductase